jgi:nicotinamidase-related amidase
MKAMQPALLIVDPQNDFFAADNPNLAEFQATVSVINSAIAVFRERRWLIVFIQHTSSKKPIGSFVWEISKHFDFKPSDTRLTKTHYNAFWDTELEAILHRDHVDFGVVAGYVAEYCVLSTLRGALERGFQGAILKHSIASLDSRHTQLTLEVSPLISIYELKA